MDAEDSLHFIPIHCRMWLTVGNRWYLETFFPTLHAQSEGIAIIPTFHAHHKINSDCFAVYHNSIK